MTAEPGESTLADLTSPVPLPSEPGDITAEWLETVLSTRHRGLRVTTLRQERVIWGNATKVLLTAEYEVPDGTTPPSRHLCVKGAFDPRVEGLTSKVLFVLESSFYGMLGSRLSTRLLNCAYAGISADGRLGVLVLEDLTAAGGKFIDPGDVLTVDQVASGLEAQAGWHGATWGATPADIPRVRVGTLARRAFPRFFSPDRWREHRAIAGAPEVPDALSNPSRVLAGYRRLWEIDDASPHSLQHGDAHVGNTFMDAAGLIGFLDWQTYCLAPWSFDVAYFIGGALSVTDRRAHERDLLRHYLGALRSAGGPNLNVDRAWKSYLQHHWHGLTWLTVPPLMQPLERSRVMATRYVAAVEDHDVARLLSV